MRASRVAALLILCCCAIGESFNNLYPFPRDHLSSPNELEFSILFSPFLSRFSTIFAPCTLIHAFAPTNLKPFFILKTRSFRTDESRRSSEKYRGKFRVDSTL